MCNGCNGPKIDDEYKGLSNEGHSIKIMKTSEETCNCNLNPMKCFFCKIDLPKFLTTPIGELSCGCRFQICNTCAGKKFPG